MGHDIKLVSVFFVLEALAILLFQVYSPLDIVLSTALGALAAAFITRRQKNRRLQARGAWGTVVFCSAAAATVFSVIYIANLYLVMVAIGITGSPYDVPAVDFVWGFFKCWAIACVTVAGVIAVFDRQVTKPRLSVPEVDANQP